MDRLDDAAGEIEVAADQRVDISRLDTVLPVLGEVSHSSSSSAPVRPISQRSVAGSATSFTYSHHPMLG